MDGKQMRLFNTLTRQKEDFEPREPGKVGLYCCGPTVYHYAHIGNLRTYIFEDVLKRVLLYDGYEVKHIMNITDVGHLTSDSDEGEDKMLKGAKREGKTVWEIAEFYEEAFFDDFHALGLLDPDERCRATAHINEMIELVKRIEANGHTYIVDGNVYFDISKFEHYPELAKLKLEGQEAGARVDVDESKRNKQDFVLWFTRSKFGDQEMQWDSPWGRGFPGWHIECSAMSIKYLGEQFDIHCGGTDHIPIHHTNEIAQSEAATGKHPWVKYWVHGEFLVVDSGKMAKSGDNFLTLNTLVEKGFDPLVYKYFCYTAHYRQQLKFNWEGMESARNTFNRLKEKVLSLKEELSSWKDPDVKGHDYHVQFVDAINDDLNIPNALAVMWSVLRDEELGNKEKLPLLMEFDKVLGLGFESWEREKVEASEDVMQMLDEREKAREAKDWAKADELRDRIKERGFVIKDSPEGPKLERA
ncbi:TPA: cysteine--tRNA ligase [Candidatus Woesearchaeota archaeon]|nr:cysteine--tRNA ligase [Candidatus Woesearchaeota archaeon]